MTTITAEDLRSLQADVARWRTPSLALLRHTQRGNTPYRSFFGPGPLMLGPDGKPQPEPASVERPVEGMPRSALAERGTPPRGRR